MILPWVASGRLLNSSGVSFWYAARWFFDRPAPSASWLAMAAACWTCLGSSGALGADSAAFSILGVSGFSSTFWYVLPDGVVIVPGVPGVSSPSFALAGFSEAGLRCTPLDFDKNCRFLPSLSVTYQFPWPSFTR